MARAETLESVVGGGGGGGGGGGRAGHYNSCSMELPLPFHPWPGLLTTSMTTSHHHNHHHHLHPVQALHLPCPLPYLHPEGTEEPRTNQPSSPASSSSSPCSRREEGGERGATPRGQRADCEREDLQEASSQQGPMPDLLPQNEPPRWASPRHRVPGDEPVEELEMRRLGSQLRTIGDDMNSTILQRAHVAPWWPGWRGAYQGVFNVITQTLYRLI